MDDSGDWSDLDDSRDGRWDLGVPGGPVLEDPEDFDVWFDAEDENIGQDLIVVDGPYWAPDGGNIHITINENNDNSSVIISAWGGMIRISGNPDSWRRFLVPIVRMLTDTTQIIAFLILGVWMGTIIWPQNSPTARVQGWFSSSIDPRGPEWDEYVNHWGNLPD